MSILKKIVIALSAATVLLLSGCKVNDTEYVYSKISKIESVVGGKNFNHYAVAKITGEKISNADNANDSVFVNSIKGIFGTNGTMIVSRDNTNGETIIVTYAGLKAGNYNTGFNSGDQIATDVLNYFITGSGSLSADTIASAKSNITYIDAEGKKWFSKTSKVSISGQTNGTSLSLINGTFEATVYKSPSESTVIKGTIHNVVGIQ